MNNPIPRRWVAAVLTLAFIASSGLMLLAQSPTTEPSEQQAAQQEQADFGQLMQELQKQAMEMQQAIGSPDTVVDAAKREAAAPKVLPPLKRMMEIAEQIEKEVPAMSAQAREMQMQFQVMAATFGDAAARNTLETTAKSEKGDAPTAAAGLLLVDWFRSDKNVETQTQILNRADELARKHSDSDEVTQIIHGMSQMGAANDELEDRAEKIATGMSSDAAKAIKEQGDASAKLEALEDKPLTITGTTVEGQTFSTDQWKGKVILVDFWATWCGPCIAELPRVKKVYDEYHDKGFEILGVSNDYSADALRNFMQKNPDMPWPQLFNADAAAQRQWNPITTGFGIDGIPTMFLIDKKGVVRTVEARENFEEMIPKLLAESD